MCPHLCRVVLLKAKKVLESATAAFLDDFLAADDHFAVLHMTPQLPPAAITEERQMRILLATPWRSQCREKDEVPSGPSGQLYACACPGSFYSPGASFLCPLMCWPARQFECAICRTLLRVGAGPAGPWEPSGASVLGEDRCAENKLERLPHGPFLGTLKSRCRIIMGTQKGTIILTTTHVLTLFAKCFAHVSGRNLWLWCVGSEPVVRAEDAVTHIQC